MSDKDQFTFEEEDDFPETKDDKQEDSGLKFDFGDDDEIESSSTTDDDMSNFNLGDEEFPETDLNAAFSDGEVEAEAPVQDVVEEPAPKKGMKLFGKKADKPKKEKKAKKEKPQKEKKPKKEKSGGGGSSSRLVLILLLLVVVAGAGYYYFMGLSETTPSVPTAPVTSQKATKSVAVPPKPAPVKQAPAPPKPAVATPAPKPAPAPAPAAAKAPVPPKPAPAEQESAKAASPAPAQVTAKAPVPPKPAPAEQESAKTPAPAAKPAAESAKTAARTPAPAESAPVVSKPTPVPAKQTPGGAFALDAGSYLIESNRDALVAKIKKLGYEPLVTPVDATIGMTRLRLGTFSKTEVKEALEFARSIEPGAYSAPAGDNYVIYAGTFLQSGNIEKLEKRFLEEGIKVYAEPVEVVRTLSRVRFGSFANSDDATAALAEVAKGGVKATVVKSR